MYACLAESFTLTLHLNDKVRHGNTVTAVGKNGSMKMENVPLCLAVFYLHVRKSIQYFIQKKKTKRHWLVSPQNINNSTQLRQLRRQQQEL